MGWVVGNKSNMNMISANAASEMSEAFGIGYAVIQAFGIAGVIGVGRVEMCEGADNFESTMPFVYLGKRESDRARASAKQQ